MSKELYSRNYWKEYYLNEGKMDESTFSTFCLTHTKPKESLLDICCGNGKDSYFFKKNGLDVSSFDISEIENPTFNFTQLDLIHKIPKFSFNKTFDNIYCRFVLHAIPENLEDYVLINSNEALSQNGLLFIEVRSDKGIITESIDNHYRRLVNIDVLKFKLKNLNFEIIYEEEKNNLSVFCEDDPILIRIIAKKKNIININSEVSFRTIRQNLKVLDFDISKHILLSTKNVLDNNNIPFLLLFGTLLGAYRDKTFIPHDTDIDVGLFSSDFKKITELLDMGYFSIYGLSIIRTTPIKQGHAHIVSLSYKNQYIDFYFFDDVDENFTCGGDKGYNIEKTQIENGGNINFLGVDFSTVNDIEKYLTDKYGADWRTPIRNKHART